MGLFSFLGNNKKKGKKVEVTKMENGYEIGVDSGKIYHCPKGLTIYKLPNGAKSLSRTACDDMRAKIVEL